MPAICIVLSSSIILRLKKLSEKTDPIPEANPNYCEKKKHISYGEGNNGEKVHDIYQN